MAVRVAHCWQVSRSGRAAAEQQIEQYPARRASARRSLGVIVISS
jgi:hypothetical protein